MPRTILLFFLVIMFNPIAAWASLGVSPAKIHNTHLLPGSKFQTTLYISRQNATNPASITLRLNGEYLDSWITGPTSMHDLILTAEQKNTLIPLTIAVPKDASLGNYLGTLSVEVTEQAKNNSASASTQPGISLPIELTVTKKKHTKLMLKNVTVTEAWAPQKFIGITESGKIVLSANINNEGNQLDTPTKAILRIHNPTNNQILYTTESKDFDKINPFQERNIDIPFTSPMRPGVYTAYVTLLNGHTPISSKPHKLELYIKEAKKYTVKEHALIILSEHRSILIPLLLALSAGVVSLFYLFAFKKKKNDPFISCAIDDNHK